MRRVSRIAAGLVAGAATAVLVQTAPASADDAVVVRGLGFPDGGLTSLSITGCPGLFDRVAEPVATYLSKSPQPPLGVRSLKYDLGGGNAVGSQHAVASMTATTVAGLSVLAPQGATGVAYAGYQAPEDRSTDLVWVGRADLVAAPGGWRRVDAAGLTYTWTQYDLATQQPVATSDEPMAVTAFAEAHGGDGPGFYTLGFGCDGNPFKVDALRIGSSGDLTTYDLEGFMSSTQIRGSRASLRAGEEVTIGGALRDSRRQRLPHGLLVLEAQEHGSEGFRPVEGGRATVDTGGDPAVTVAPTTRTLYRWRFAGTWSVDGSLSPTFTVEVATAVTARTDGSGVPDGRPLVVAGTTQPAQPGVRATLWRLLPAGRAPLATTRIGEDGTFRFEVDEQPPGPWRYVVTVPAVPGNLAGESAVRSVAPTPIR